MDIKIIAGFVDQDRRLDKDTDRIRSGRTFTGVDKQYADALVRNGLARETTAEDAKAKKPPAKPGPASTKPAAPVETK